MVPGEIHVGMGEGVVGASPHVLVSLGIGSCVVLTLYDRRRKVGGLAHVMLPDSAAMHVPFVPFQCADTALAALLEGLRERGTLPSELEGKLVGGARMFSAYEDRRPAIGRQNLRSLKNLLAGAGIPLAGWDVGGHHGRSAEFHLASGRLVVKALGFKDKEF